MKDAGSIMTEGLAPDFDSEMREAGRLFRRSAIAVTLAFWLYSFAVIVARTMLDVPAHEGAMLLMRLVVTFVGIGFCFCMHLLLSRLDARPFWQRALVLTLIAPVAADAFAWVNSYGLHLVSPGKVEPFPISATIYAVVYWVWFFMAWGALYLALRYSFQIKEEERRSRVVQALAHAAQLRVLRNQISPHFLFNTLNSISSLILDKRSDEADAMVLRLSEFFRVSLAVEPLEDIKLEEELRLQTYYLDIERARFPDLTVKVSVPPDLLEALVPTLILQPVVENAVKYAIAKSHCAATIQIEAAVVNTRLQLSIIDDGRGSGAGPGTGIGLSNVRGRLLNRFGNDFRFEAGPKLPHGFVVRFEIPLRFAT